ncbi:MAG: MogA/MoaB family molybdenum cofactor biosynthesis protein [Gemmatimonadetes bacterium]|nr:MogA/MoaB family molybdenum cofactor biosynthesis protein [Gemmatimonadota bacterium]
MPSFALLTSSDTAARGGRVDTSGDAIVEMMTGAGFNLVERRVLPDDETALSEAISAWCDRGDVDVVLTTGGTGLAPRDVMPQATAKVVDYQVPGIAEAIRLRTLEKTPMAMISRAMAGVRGRTLILNLPGSRKAVQECLEVALPILPHAVDILRGRGADHPLHGRGSA